MDNLEPPEHRDQRDQLVLQEIPEVQGLLDQLGLQESKVQLVLQVSQVLVEHLDLMDSPVRQVR